MKKMQKQFNLILLWKDSCDSLTENSTPLWDMEYKMKSFPFLSTCVEKLQFHQFAIAIFLKTLKVRGHWCYILKQ